MATIFSWIFAGILIFFVLTAAIGAIPLLLNRVRREARGDIFLMNKDSNEGSPPVELRAQRDYRYKDANVNPYAKERNY